MKIYTIEESGYKDLHKTLDKMCEIVKYAKHALEEIEPAENSGWRYEDDDFDWKIKKGYRPPRY